ncbi:MAG: AtpZ/AtpI family protein [Gemmatimonadaceae bacterium]
MTGTDKDHESGANRAPDAGGGTSPGEFAGLGLQFVIAILGGLYAGQWLDRKLGTAPWFLLIGVFSGAGLSFYSMYHKLMKAQTREDAAKKAGREGQP